MNGKILRCNKAMESLLKKFSKELIGGTCWKLVYVSNNPILFVDPDGLLRIPGTGKIIGWGTKWVAKKIGGKLGEKIGELAGFFNPEIGYPSEQQKMDKDTDGDGINDFFDPDDYNNGVPNVSDVQPINYSENRTLANK